MLGVAAPTIDDRLGNSISSRDGNTLPGMGKTQFTARVAMRRWTATLDDVALLIDRLLKVVARDGIDPSLEITVEQPGMTLEYDTTAEFKDQTTADDLQRIETIAAQISDNRERPMTVALTVDTSHSDVALRIRIAGPDRTIVEGTRVECDEAARLGQRGGVWLAEAAAYISFPVVFILIIFAAVHEWIPHVIIHAGTVPATAFVIVCGALLVAVMVVPPLVLFPSFEWLSIDGQTRWDRSRRRVLQVLGAITLTVVAGLILAFLTHAI